MSGGDQYLLAVYIESQRSGVPVSSGAVADRLDKSPPSVTEMLQRLDERGLVMYEPYEGVALTEAGQDRATAPHESYVTLSWFFRSVLELETHESEALELAGVIDPSVAKRLTAMLPVDELQVEDASQEQFDPSLIEVRRDYALGTSSNIWGFMNSRRKCLIWLIGVRRIRKPTTTGYWQRPANSTGTGGT